MKKKFLSSLILLILVNLLVKPFWLLGIDRSVQEMVGEEDYGLYFSLFSLSLILNIFLDAGITNFNSKNIAQHNQLLKKHLSGILTIRLLLGLVYMLILIVIGLLLGYRGHEVFLIFVLGVNQFLASLILYARSNLQGLHEFKKDSFLSIFDRLLMISICAFLLWSGIIESEFKIEWFVYAQTAAYALAAIIALSMVGKFSGKIKISLNLPFSFMILRQSLPFALLILLMFIYSRVDAVMLERMLPDGKNQAGIYAKAYRLLDALNMIAYLFAVLLLPIFARLIKEKKQVGSLVTLAFKLLFMGSATVAIICFFYGKEIMELMYTNPSNQLFQIITYLMFGFIAMSTTYVFGTLLTANNNLKWLNTMAVGGVLLNVVLNYFLIPQYLAFGAVIATLITQFITCFAQIIMAKVEFNWSFNIGLVVSSLLFVLGLGGIGYFLPENYPWLLSISILSITALILAFTTGLIRVKEVMSFVKSELKSVK